MALQGAPGGENPSAAYLAGQQHGQTLAAQHAAKPPGAPSKPTKAPASPTKKPAKTSAPAQTLLQQAEQIAQAQTAAQIAAIRQQQDLYNQQAQAKAGQINSATQAAAQLLQNWNLGGTTAKSYDQAANTIGGLAQGFSGQTGVNATNAAAQVAANLANLGAPDTGAKTSTGQVSNPDALKNVLYGLGGFIPGNLLETSGQAAAAVQRGLPGSLLSYGQGQAAGAVTAGQNLADTLTPQILDAEGKLPTLASQALSNLTSLQNTAFNQKLDIAKFNAAQSSTAFNQKISVAKLNLESQRIAQSQFNSDRSYQISLARLGIAQQGLALRVTQNAFKAAHGGYTAVAIKKFNLQANAYANAGYHGTTSTTTNAAGVSSTSVKGAGQPYFQVLGQMLKKGIPVQNALAALDRVYPPNLRPSDQALQNELGPLTPAAVQQAIQTSALSGIAAGGRIGQPPLTPAQIIGQANQAGTAQVKAIKTTAFNMAAKYGWGDAANISALDRLWTNESGWNPNAKNGSSGALGIPQALGHTLPPGYATNAATQIKWGLDYIKRRYGSPAAALAFWYGPKPPGGPQGHWY